jgi:redox-sensitive bicupin YhaK (pirin superfamily)
VIRLRPAAGRGHFRNGWLDARFSFNFGSYREPGLDGYSDLLVLNEDWVAPGGGFAEHPHADVEVMSWPLEGTVEHRDSLGHHALLQPGDVHLMRAGTGIRHSEMNASATLPERHLQWWIRPARRGLAPAYAKLHVPREARRNRWRLLAAPDGAEGALPLAQDARVLAAWLQGHTLQYQPPPGRLSYLHVASGAVRVGGHALEGGDAAFIENEPSLVLQAGAGEGAELLLFDLRPV